MVILTNVQRILLRIIILKNIRILHFIRSKKKCNDIIQIYIIKSKYQIFYKNVIDRSFTIQTNFSWMNYFILKKIINDFFIIKNLQSCIL